MFAFPDKEYTGNQQRVGLWPLLMTEKFKISKDSGVPEPLPGRALLLIRWGAYRALRPTAVYCNELLSLHIVSLARFGNKGTLTLILGNWGTLGK